MLAPLAGGQGRSWRAGLVVLKPKSGDGPEAIEWLSGFVAAMNPGGAFRVAAPVPSSAGEWTVDGWQASNWLEGSHLPGAWDRVLEVSAHFHRAATVACSTKPGVLDGHDDPWSTGDRIAWGEREPDPTWPASVLGALDRLRPLLDSGSRPDVHAQVIHGDLGGNVVFADDAGLAPAVIDVSPFWRPAPYADAIVVADAVAWDGAPLTLAIRFLAHEPDGTGDELLARAIAFRLATAAVHWPALPARVDAEVDAYAPLLPLLRS